MDLCWMSFTYNDGNRKKKGKNVPVITKALVELEGQMFKSYAAVRDKWALLDCY